MNTDLMAQLILIALWIPAVTNFFATPVVSILSCQAQLLKMLDNRRFHCHRLFMVTSTLATEWVRPKVPNGKTSLHNR